MRKLTSNQLEVLRLIDLFRFCTSEQIARLQNKRSSVFVHKCLSILVKEELLGRRYDSSYRLAGKAAEYYLTPKGYRAVNAKSVAYKNGTASQALINQHINLAWLFLAFNSQVSSSTKYYPKNLLKDFEYFPSKLPSGYLRVKDKGLHFFLEHIDSVQPYFLPVNLIKSYVDYFESGDWDVTGTANPTVIIVCDNSESVSASITKKIDPGLLDFNVFLVDSRSLRSPQHTVCFDLKLGEQIALRQIQ